MADFVRLTMVTAALVLGLSGSVMDGPGPVAAGEDLQTIHGLVPAGSEFPVQQADDDDHHGMWGDWDGWGWWIFMAPMMLVFWGGVIWLVVWLVRPSSSSAGRTAGHDVDAVEVARRRYARGDISREEFEQIRRDLNA
jgi:putative membrane protein